MKNELTCDACNIVIIKPFVRLTQEIKCSECDFSIIWDGEKTNSVIEKRLTYQRGRVQYLLSVDMIENRFTVKIAQHDNYQLRGTTVMSKPIHNGFMRLDYDLIKSILKKLDKYAPMK